MDWRGQGGSQRAQDNPLKSYVRDYGDFDGDFAAFMNKVVMPLTDHPPIVLAHSWADCYHPRDARPSRLVPLRHTQRTDAAFLDARLSRDRSAAASSLYSIAGKAVISPGAWRDRDPFKVGFDGQLVTSDPEALRGDTGAVAQESRPAVGRPDMGLYRSGLSVNRKDQRARLSGSHLDAGSDRRRRQGPHRGDGGGEAFSQRLPRGEYLEIAEAEHEILMEQGFHPREVLECVRRVHGNTRRPKRGPPKWFPLRARTARPLT